MKPWELYEEIKKTEYTKSGDSVDWAVKVYPDEKLIRLLFEESTEDRDWRNNFDFPLFLDNSNILFSDCCAKALFPFGNFDTTLASGIFESPVNNLLSNRYVKQLGQCPGVSYTFILIEG